MKLASLKSGRDGRLIVVNRSLSRAAFAPVATMQIALDDWDEVEPKLRALSDQLNSDDIEGFAFDPAACTAPLPRAYQWLDGSAFVNHVELVRRSRGEELPEWYWREPLMYQGGSDVLLGPTEDICLADEAWGIDFEGEIGVILGDVSANASPAQCRAAVRLVVLINDVSLRNLIPAELSKGFGFVQSKPATGFAAVAVTPDELGAAWDGKRLHLRLDSCINGEPFGAVETGPEMTFDFPTLIEHATKTRALGAGTILGSGTVSNRGIDGGPGRSIAAGGRGYSCISEQRMAETIQTGSPRTPFLRKNDCVRLEVLDESGQSVFGTIRQKVSLRAQAAANR